MKLTRTYLCAIFFVFLATSTAHLIAQSEEAQYDKLMNDAFDASGPGATALVAKNGKIVYHKAFGKANMELDVDMRPEMVFEIGSITKQFTAVSILMLVEQGKIKLEDDITTYISDYPTHGHHISIHHLLTHTSGIKSYTNMESMADYHRLDKSPAELIDLFKNEPMEFAPGDKWNYNNSAYFILGHIIELITEMSYEEFLDKHIFQPLGMENSYYGSMSEIIKNRAYGYQKNGEKLVNAEYLSLTLPYAAGSIMSTVEDLNTWQKALKAGKVIKPESLDLAYSNYKLNDGKPFNYGYGWAIDEIFGSPTVEHSGGIFGYLTNGIYLPEEDVYVIVFSNCNCNPPSEVSTRMASIAIGKPFPSKDAAIKLKEEELKNLVGMYEFEDGAKRNIVFEDGQLFSVRSGNRFEIYPASKEKFFFDESTASYSFSYNSDGEPAAVQFDNRINSSKGKRVSKEIMKKTSIRVSEDVLKQYVGSYQIQPGFIMDISLEDGKLISQATNQPTFQLHAETETRFFVKEFEAALEFVKGPSGKFNEVVLYQGEEKLQRKGLIEVRIFICYLEAGSLALACPKEGCLWHALRDLLRLGRFLGPLANARPSLEKT